MMTAIPHKIHFYCIRITNKYALFIGSQLPDNNYKCPLNPKD